MTTKADKLQQLDINNEANRLFGRMQAEEIVAGSAAKRGVMALLKVFHREKQQDVFDRQPD